MSLCLNYGYVLIQNMISFLSALKSSCNWNSYYMFYIVLRATSFMYIYCISIHAYAQAHNCGHLHNLLTALKVHGS